MKKYIFFIIIIFFTASQSVALAENQDIDIRESYSWFNKDNNPSYNISFEKNQFLINKESQGWIVENYEEEDIFYAQNYLKDFQQIYPEEIISKYVDNIVLIKSINIDGDYYAGTIKDRDIYTAVNINPNEEQIWIKMVLAHEFYHVREKYHSKDLEDSPYKDFSKLVDSMNLNFYKDNGYSFHDWSNLETKKYGRNMFKKGFIREYSLFSKKEFMANIAQGVDSGAYIILSRVSPDIKSLMDAYIKGNIQMFKEEGYYIDEKFYTEFLPNYISSNHTSTYNKLRGLYSYDRITFEEFVLNNNYLLLILIISLIFYKPVKRKYKYLLETQEERSRRIKWEKALYGTKTLKEG